MRAVVDVRLGHRVRARCRWSTAPAASEVTGQVIAGTGPAGAVSVSAIEIELTVESPELVTLNE